MRDRESPRDSLHQAGLSALRRNEGRDSPGGLRRPVQLDVVNIESNPELLARYRYEIPVLLIDGVEAFRHRLRTEDFKARLSGPGR